jgi:hypothetical protein
MTSGRLDTVLDHLRGLVRRVDTPGDGLLLGRFARDRDESAFAELVRRHGPLVYGTTITPVKRENQERMGS